MQRHLTPTLHRQTTQAASRLGERCAKSSAFWFLPPDHAEEEDTDQAHETGQDHTPDGSITHAPLKEKDQCDGRPDHLSLAENEAKNGTPSRLHRCAFRMGMHCPNYLSRNREAGQRRPGYKLVTSGRHCQNGANSKRAISDGGHIKAGAAAHLDSNGLL